MNIYLDLFFTFAKMGVCTFGGGYAMLPILQREVVDKRGWATEEELADYYAIGQCTPGIIAVNTATFIGCKLRGWVGGTVATLGLVFPSIVIITLIAAFLSNFADIPAVQHAMTGVNACVVALIASSVLKLGKTTVKNAFSAAIFLLVLVFAKLSGLLGLGTGTLLGQVLELLSSPVILVVLAGLLGYGAALVKGAKGGEGK